MSVFDKFRTPQPNPDDPPHGGPEPFMLARQAADSQGSVEPSAEDRARIGDIGRRKDIGALITETIMATIGKHGLSRGKYKLGFGIQLDISPAGSSNVTIRNLRVSYLGATELQDGGIVTPLPGRIIKP